MPTPTPFAVVSASETVTSNPNNSEVPCPSMTVTAAGSFVTNGAGGVVTYQWVRVDENGQRTVVSESPIVVQPGDTSVHQVVPDSFNPDLPGRVQLVFLSPAAPSVPAQRWNCGG
jgi:hypothetical protein